MRLMLEYPSSILSAVAPLPETQLVPPLVFVDISDPLVWRLQHHSRVLTANDRRQWCDVERFLCVSDPPSLISFFYISKSRERVGHGISRITVE